MKYTAIALGLVAAGTLAVLLFYKPAPPVVPLPPETPPHVFDPHVQQTAGDHPQHEQPQMIAVAPPRTAPNVGGPSVPGSAAMPPTEPGSTGFGGKGGNATGAEGSGDASDGGKAKRFNPDKDGIREAMKSALPELRDCYESWLATDPKLGGKMTLAFTIAPNDAGGGSVQDLSVASKDIAHLPFEGCVKNVMAGLEFATPYDDSSGEPGPMSVRYPLTFSSWTDGGP